MSSCKWLKLNSVSNSTSLCGTPHLATWSYDVTMIYFTCAITIDAFVNKFKRSNHDVTIVSGSQATGRTGNAYSGSKLKTGATRYSIVTDCNYECSCWMHYWTSTASWVVYFDGATKRKRRNGQNYTAVPVTFIYGCKHYDHHKYKRIITFHIS